MRKLDELQEKLYDLEDFLESNRENEVLEFVADHWKECLTGGLVTFFVLYQGRTFITVSNFLLENFLGSCKDRNLYFTFCF